MTIKPFKEFISENINVVDDALIFNDVEGIETAFGKGSKLTPFKKTVPGTDMTSFSLYQAKGANDILKALKSANFNDPEVRQFINRSGLYGARIIRKFIDSPDIIVSPKSSSDLTKELALNIQSRTNYDFFIDSFQKTVDLDKIDIHRDDPRITDDIISSMEKTLKRGRKKGFISVKQFAPQHRKFVKDLFEVLDENLYNKVIDKNVVIIDDVMTTGTTAKQIYDKLIAHGATEVTTLTMFKATS